MIGTNQAKGLSISTHSIIHVFNYSCNLLFKYSILLNLNLAFLTSLKYKQKSTAPQW
jgi:hypothetical protein